MPITAFDLLACPLDGSPLHCVDKSWRCENGHSFDVARQGYVHLLPVQKKRTLDPGDSKDMVAARQRFLSAGYYRPIAEAINQAVIKRLPTGAKASCLDAGCGEGYYLQHLTAAVPTSIELALLGLDISKWAVLAAAKRDRTPRWVVGSNANLPVLSETLDMVLCLFGFPVYPEFARVLKPSGTLLQADAGPDHLRELREIIYPELKPAKDRQSKSPEGFHLLHNDNVRYELELPDGEAIADLLAMTPHLYRASAEGREKASRLEYLSVTIDVDIQCWERNPTANLDQTLG